MTTVKQKVSLPFFPEPYMTKEDAIKRAKDLKAAGYAVCVLKSTPTELGKAFYVEPLDTMIRTCETLLYRSEK